MKTRFSTFASSTLLLALAVASLTACRTFEYREIQADFEEAVRADNAGTPFSRQHEDVLARLTPENIARLDPKLRANAWMLRAVSAWRAGSNTVAEESARLGLADPQLTAGSRDQVVLAMIPALVVDSDLQRRWLASNRQVSTNAYAEAYEPGFTAALRELSEGAAAKMTERTPVDARAYYHYQRWRLLLNWAAVISSVNPPPARFAAQDRALQFLQTTGLDVSAAAERDRIPADHPLRALIRAQGGQ